MSIILCLKIIIFLTITLKKRIDHGLVTIQDAAYGVACIFLVVTVLIALFKKEQDLPPKETPPPLIETYKISYKILFLGRLL